MEQKKKKIAFILGSMSRGGAERVISNLSKEFAMMGWDTDICLLLDNTVAYELDQSTRVLNFTKQSKSRLKNAPHWLHSIREYAKKEKPDVILSFAARINVLTLFACLGLHKKIVVSERNDPKFDGRGFATKLLIKMLYPLSSNVVFQTDRVKSYFSKRIQSKGIVIPNPCDVSIVASREDANKIVAVGRLSEQKNHKMLIDSFAEVQAKHPQKELYIYGEGHLRETLQQQINQMNLTEKVHLVGNVLNVHEQIKNASMFVLSSDYEGLSNALLEAMSMGLPCISTDCAGSDEYIENKNNGLLVPVGNQQELTKAMLLMIEDESLRNKCAENAKAVKERVSYQATIKQWQSVLE